MEFSRHKFSPPLVCKVVGCTSILLQAERKFILMKQENPVKSMGLAI